MNETIVEIFSSLQGEGPYVGYRQIFIRFAGCNLRCNYCDTSESFHYEKMARIENQAGSGKFKFVANPMAIADIAGQVRHLLMHRHHSISLTGGEPLCHAAAINELASFFKMPFYLETNGVLVDELAEVLPVISIISMDIKLPSSTGQDCFAAHSRFLKLAITKDLFIKIVLSGESSDDEFAEALSVIASAEQAIPLVLQPVSAREPGQKLTGAKLLSFFEMATKRLENVRVIPQVHKILNVL